MWQAGAGDADARDETSDMGPKEVKNIEGVAAKHRKAVGRMD